MSNAPERIHLRNGEVNKGQVSPFDDCYIRRDAITPAMAARVLLDTSYDDRSCGFKAAHDAPPEFGGWLASFLHAIAAQGEDQ